MEIVIHTVTSLYVKNPNADGNKTQWRDTAFRNRIVAVYKSLEDAQRCVNLDLGSFSEAGYYNYIVIEGLNEGCYPGLGEHEWWYVHDDDKNCWVECKRPHVLDGIVNFYG